MSNFFSIGKFEFLAIVFCLSLLASCGINGEKTKPKEGTLEYEVTYPYYDAGIFGGILPDRMVMSFKDGKFMNTIAHKNGMFSYKVITSCKERNVRMLLSIGTNNYYIEMDEKTADSLFHAQFAMPEIFLETGIDTAAGFIGNRATAVFSELEDGPDMDLLYTNDIELNEPNWCTQFRDIDAVLLKYELEQYGMRLRVQADKFSTESVDDEIFEIGTRFEEVSIQRMMKELTEIFELLQSN